MKGQAPPAPRQHAYVCGHSAREIGRLAIQSRIYDAITRRALLRASIGAGQHVVDLGCGGGDVCLIAAELVGRSGRVTGVDRSPEAAASARTRLAYLPQVQVAVAELDAWQPGEPVDAVIGRFVLMHQPNPVAALARARQWIRPGGVVTFVESDTAACRPGLHSEPHSPTYQRIVDVWQATMRAAGAHADMGSTLAGAFVAAGLDDPSIEIETYTSGDPASPIFRFAAESLRSMLPLATAAGIPTPDASEVDGLEDTLRREVVTRRGILRAPPAYAVWARVP